MPKEENKKEQPKLLPDDFYINEQGFMVFTESYHLKRGNCCENNCLHCPYSKKQSSKSEKHLRF